MLFAGLFLEDPDWSMLRARECVLLCGCHGCKVSSNWKEQDIFFSTLASASWTSFLHTLSSLPVLDNLAVDFSHTDSCDIFLLSKHTHEVFQESSNKAVTPFEFVHCDVWSSYRTPASCGAVYFIIIIDDYSRAVWIHHMLKKSEVAPILKILCAVSLRQFGHQVKTFRTDNGTKFVALKQYFQQEGIKHLKSSVDTTAKW